MPEKEVKPKLADAETRSLSNQGRIVELEAKYDAMLANKWAGVKSLAVRIAKFQKDVDRLSKLFTMHGGE